MKHISIITLFALIIIFAGCNPQFIPENESETGHEIARVQVDIGGNARTLLPVLDNGFSKYVLSAESADNSQAAPSPVELTGYSGNIYLPYGEWIITATAYVHAGGVDYAAARGSASLTVENTYHSVSIAVIAPEPGGTGTFNYTVRYPASGSASIQLERWPLGQGTVVNEAISGDGSHNVPSGVYFLTVTATANGRTVIRNDIVHIYAQSPTKVDYVFTKLDFGGGPLNLSGTVQVLVNGVQPDQAYLWRWYSIGQTNYQDRVPIEFTGSDGSGTWEFALSDLRGAAALYFKAGLFDQMSKELPGRPIPVDDEAGIDLGTVDITVEPLGADTWVDGDIMTPNADDWYSIDVTAATPYYFWLNNNYDGDGTKTLYGYFAAFYSSGGYIIESYGAWSNPVYFTASSNDTVYIRVATNLGETGSYAIVYSTNSNRPSYPFTPPNPSPLAIDTWVDGEITTPYVADWYSIDVTQGTTYYFWRNDYYNSGGSKTLETDVFAYSSAGVVLFSEYWYAPVIFTAADNDTVYLRVRHRYGNSSTGTYAIMYSDRPRVNVQVEIRTAFDQNDRLYLYYNSEVYQGNGLWARIDYSWGGNPVISYSWYIDGVRQEGYTNSEENLPTTGLSPGIHYGLAVVTIDGADFSREFSFRVYQ